MDQEKSSPKEGSAAPETGAPWADRGKVRQKRGRKFTAAQRDEIIQFCWINLRLMYEPRHIVKALIARYNVSQQQANEYIRTARFFGIKQIVASTEQVRATVAAYVQNLLVSAGPDASISDKLACVDRLTRLFGLNASTKIDLRTHDRNSDAEMEELEKFRARLLLDPEIAEAAHQLVERSLVSRADGLKAEAG